MPAIKIIALKTDSRSLFKTSTVDPLDMPIRTTLKDDDYLIDEEIFDRMIETCHEIPSKLHYD